MLFNIVLLFIICMMLVYALFFSKVAIEMQSKFMTAK